MDFYEKKQARLNELLEQYNAAGLSLIDWMSELTEYFDGMSSECIWYIIDQCSEFDTPEEVLHYYDYEEYLDASDNDQ